MSATSCERRSSPPVSRCSLCDRPGIAGYPRGGDCLLATARNHRTFLELHVSTRRCQPHRHPAITADWSRPGHSLRNVFMLAEYLGSYEFFTYSSRGRATETSNDTSSRSTRSTTDARRDTGTVVPVRGCGARPPARISRDLPRQDSVRDLSFRAYGGPGSGAETVGAVRLGSSGRRNPAIFEDPASGRVFLLYAVGGESRIAIAAIHLNG